MGSIWVSLIDKSGGAEDCRDRICRFRSKSSTTTGQITGFASESYPPIQHQRTGSDLCREIYGVACR